MDGVLRLDIVAAPVVVVETDLAEVATHEREEAMLLTPRMRRDSFFSSSPPGETPGGKFAEFSPLPRGPRWSDICDDDFSGGEEAEEGQELRQELDASPKSPSKSARRANRRRRCREAARAAAAEAVEAAGQQAAGGTTTLLLPAGAFINAGFGQLSAAGNCTPTCVSSPVRGTGPPPGSFGKEADGSPRGGGATLGAVAGLAVMSTSPQAQGMVGDASTRTPTAATCSSPYMCTTGPHLDASARMLPAGACLVLAPAPQAAWGVLSSPTSATRTGSLSTSPSPQATIVSTSPLATPPAGSGTRAPAPSPVAATGCGSAAAAEALRTLLGPTALAGDDLAARLRAAAPEIYED